MKLDSDALSDRLYADAVAAGLRWSRAFCEGRTHTSWEVIEPRVRERAREHAIDLSATAAEAETAFEMARDRWQRLMGTDSTLKEIDLLSRVANNLLQLDGRDMILIVDRKQPGREILRWRFISLAIPPTILVAAAARDGVGVPTRVRILHRSIGPDLSVAQNHLHHASLPTFEELWSALRVRALTRPGEFIRLIQDERAYCPGLHLQACIGSKSTAPAPLTPTMRRARMRHMSEWADLINRAFIARRVIHHHSRHHEMLSDCSDAICKKGLAMLGPFMAGRAEPHNVGGACYPWREEAFALARDARQSSSSTSTRRLAGSSSDSLVEESARERLILAQGFDLLRSSKALDCEYEKLFLQYLRVKTAVFALLVHSPGEHGLAKFLQHFTQIKVYAPEADRLPPRVPVEPGLTVQATEYRVAPDAWLETLRHDELVEERFADTRERVEHRENGWIIHFKRKGPGKGLPLFSAEQRTIRKEAAKIANALTQVPSRLEHLRGIDICGVEGWQPLWVSANSLRWLRERSRTIVGTRPGLGLEPLRLTLHAGEDFRWLTTGMRTVAEPFYWKLIERGDRIGHGIAVTLDPDGWWDRHEGGVEQVAHFDRLLDLAFLVVYADARSPEQTDWLRAKIRDVARYIWPNHFEKVLDVVPTVLDVWKHLGGVTVPRLMNSSRVDTGAPLYEQCLHAYLWDRSVQMRASRPLVLKVADDHSDARNGSSRYEKDLLIKAWKTLVREIASWQVCLESNPSSNLVIASLDSVASQDFLHVRSTIAAGVELETLTWTISTDNPITFSTSLADEYAYAWAGMVRRTDKRCDPSYARALLDEAAATSMRMRFTVPRLAPAKVSTNGSRR